MLKKIVLGAIAGLASIGLVAGCGSPSSTGVTTNTSTTGNSITANTTAANVSTPNTTSNSIGSTNNSVTPNRTPSSSTQSRGGPGLSADVMPAGAKMPQPPTAGNLETNTAYGTISFSTSERKITTSNISVYISHSGLKSVLYTFSSKNNFKQVVWWQISGKYLYVKFGEPYSANPTTTDYGYKDVVIDLSTRKTVVTTVSDVQSMDYLSGPYFVQSGGNVNPLYGTVSVWNLPANEWAEFALPKNFVTQGVVSGAALYYGVQNGAAKQTLTVSLTKANWKPMTITNVQAIPLPSK